MQIRYSIGNNEHAWASCLLFLAIILIMAERFKPDRDSLNAVAAELAACRSGVSPADGEVECAP